MRQLSAEALEELCDLRAKCGEGDLLDFIHWIQKTAKKEGWSVAQVVNICAHMPADPARVGGDE